MNADIINEALLYTRNAVLTQIEKLIEIKRGISGSYKELYTLLSDYPFRKGKALRPGLCIAVARASGGHAQAALVSSAALEMYHNAALIHDDCEDDSDLRRGKDTIHSMIGIPRAVNLGDATHVLALSFLLENLKSIGVAKSLYVMHEIENMARQSVEGQAMELDWIANRTFDLQDRDYLRMCVKKTCWYTFMTPCRIGYMVGTNNWNSEFAEKHLAQLTEFGMALGIAFQIQDDLLNLDGKLEAYGKEIGGDIYEGKRTIMLNHVIENSSQADKIREIISKPRGEKTRDDIAFIMQNMTEYHSIDYGRKLAREYASKAGKILEKMDFLVPQSPLQQEENWECEVVDRRLIEELVNYVVERNL